MKVENELKVVGCVAVMLWAAYTLAIVSALVMACVWLYKHL